MVRNHLLRERHVGVVVGPRGAAAGTVELKRRATGQREEVSLDAALARIRG